MKTMKSLLSAIVAALLTLSFAACGKNNPLMTESTNSSTECNNITIIYSNRLNCPLPQISLLKENLSDICSSGGQVVLINNDSKPEVTTIEVPAIESMNYTTNKKKSMVSENVNAIEQAILATKADDADADLIECLRIAAETDSDQIYIFDNGLLTAGSTPMDFYIDFLKIDESVERLNNAKKIPDFSGKTIHFYGVSQTTSDGDQQPLTPLEASILTDFWQAYFNESGGQFDISTGLTSEIDKPEGDYPSVRVVPILTDDDGLVQEEAPPETVESESEPVQETKTLTLKRFDTNKISFEPDSYKISNKDKAIISLSSVIDYLNNTDDSIVIGGATATVLDSTAESCRKFGAARAESVKELLLESCNIDESRIIVVGLGYTSDFQINDIKDGKVIDEGRAQSNRVVYIAAVDSPDGEKLLQYK